MRNRMIALLWLAAVTTASAAPPAMTPGEAAQHRGQLVTIAGTVSSLGGHPGGIIVRLGDDPALPILIPSAVRAGLRTDPTELVGRTIEVTGFVSSTREPLQLRLSSASQLRLASTGGGSEVEALRRRVAQLEHDLDRLAPRLVAEARSAVVVGSTRPTPAHALPLGSTQTTVLAHHGVPTRVEWSQNRRVLYYNRERWSFDAEGQLLDVTRN